MASLPRRAVLLGLAMTGAANASAQAPSPEAVRSIAPTGRLRAAINLGNPVLARRDGAGLGGISVDLAGDLGRRLGLPVDLVPFETAGLVPAALADGTWDVCFLAIDPVRAAGIAFTAPYVVIEGTYMVREGSPLRRIEDVDAAGIRVAVGKGSAYDLYLTRALKHAEIVRAPTSQAAVALFAAGGPDVVASVRQPVVQYAREHPGYRVMEGRFMAIEQAMGVPKGREPALVYLKGFVEEAKASGFVAEALKRNGQPDAMVAPAT